MFSLVSRGLPPDFFLSALPTITKIRNLEGKKSQDFEQEIHSSFLSGVAGGRLCNTQAA
jgi:hypothetical protein